MDGGAINLHHAVFSLADDFIMLPNHLIINAFIMADSTIVQYLIYIGWILLDGGL